MNIINIEIQEWTTVLFKFNWLAIVIILALYDTFIFDEKMFKPYKQEVYYGR